MISGLLVARSALTVLEQFQPLRVRRGYLFGFVNSKAITSPLVEGDLLPFYRAKKQPPPQEGRLLNGQLVAVATWLSKYRQQLRRSQRR